MNVTYCPGEPIKTLDELYIFTVNVPTPTDSIPKCKLDIRFEMKVGPLVKSISSVPVKLGRLITRSVLVAGPIGKFILKAIEPHLSVIATGALSGDQSCVTTDLGLNVKL